MRAAFIAFAIALLTALVGMPPAAHASSRALKQWGYGDCWDIFGIRAHSVQLDRCSIRSGTSSD